ncbi:hypothetical protein C4552_03155 [Candidatus Parcubacteria bacterium]|nr:MAG: hypothetical protein C4552_03155 [Candidatus Parcubacteria bacterium]
MFFTLIAWHYGPGLRFTASNALYLPVGMFRYFSVATLTRTLLAPWHRILTPRGRGFDPAAFFTAIGENFVSRLAGAIVRIFVIAFGLAATVVSAVIGAAWLGIWLFLPAAVPAIAAWGVILVADAFR